MTKHSRHSPAPATAMAEADRELLAPILTDFRARLAEARKHTPGGQLTCDEITGVRRTTAARHRVTPEDLARWHLAHPEQRS